MEHSDDHCGGTLRCTAGSSSKLRDASSLFCRPPASDGLLAGNSLALLTKAPEDSSLMRERTFGQERARTASHLMLFLSHILQPPPQMQSHDTARTLQDNDDTGEGGSSDVPFQPASPTGIPSWIWMTLLTLFMLAIIFVSVRGLYAHLPVSWQRYLRERWEDAQERIALANPLQRRSSHWGRNGRIRLSADGPHQGVQIGSLTVHADGESSASDEDDDDDELPLATRLQDLQSDRRLAPGRNGLLSRSKVDRVVSLFSGKGTDNGIGHSYRNALHLGADDEERILDLPHTQMPRGTSSKATNPRKLVKPRLGERRASASSSSSSDSLFQLQEASAFQHSNPDAPILPTSFSLQSLQEQAGGGATASSQRRYSDTPPPTASASSPARRHSSAFITGTGGPLSPSCTSGGFASPFAVTNAAYMVRSPTRSPSLSRTPSLLAIREESSPRSSSEEQRSSSANLPRTLARTPSATSSESQDLPDWRSAHTTNSALTRFQLGRARRSASASSTISVTE